MPSPFPGMDPFLEDPKIWPVFQHHLVMSLYQFLLPGLADRYRARISQRHYATEQVLFTSIQRDEHQEDICQRCATHGGLSVTGHTGRRGRAAGSALQNSWQPAARQAFGRPTHRNYASRYSTNRRVTLPSLAWQRK